MALALVGGCGPDPSAEVSDGGTGDSGTGPGSDGTPPGEEEDEGSEGERETFDESDGDESGEDDFGSTGGATGGSTGYDDPIDDSECGDGIREGAEVCDDGNTDDDDGCSATCDEADCLVPITHTTVVDAVADEACPTVWVMPGTYWESIVIDRDIEIVGVYYQDGRDGDDFPFSRPNLDGNGDERVIEILAGTTVALRHVEISEGRGEQGAGIHSSGSLELDQVVLRSNRAIGADPCGGGVWSDHALTLRDTEFDYNRAQLDGASGTARGGAVCVVGGTLDVEDSLFTINYAEAEAAGEAHAFGGAIYADQADVTVTASIIYDNRVSAEGGGRVAATSSGGGIHQRGGTLTLTDTDVDDNTAGVSGLSEDGSGGTAQGGAVALDGVTATVTGGSIHDNGASLSGAGTEFTARGGGIHVEGESVLRVDDAVVRDNGLRLFEEQVAPRFRGAGISAYAGASQLLVLELTAAWINDNLVSGGHGSHGGGLFLGSDAPGAVVRLEAHASTIDDNLASVGAGLSAQATDGGAVEVELVNSTVTYNSAPTHGAIALQGNVTAGLWSSTVSRNWSSGEDGAGLWIEDGAEVSLANAAVIGNNFIGEIEGWADCGPATASITSLGHNAWGVLDCQVVGGEDTDIFPEDPMLLDAEDNGGPTLTMELAAGSPLRNAGDPAGCTDADGVELVVDQRGEDRPAEGICDIGAYERQP